MQVPHSLTVSAQLKNLSIRLIQDVYGDTVGPVSVPYGLIPTYTFIPKPGYKLDQVLMDTLPVAITPLLQYTFPAPVTIDHTIQAFFKPLP